jgi:hypothetical protein
MPSTSVWYSNKQSQFCRNLRSPSSDLIYNESSPLQTKHKLQAVVYGKLVIIYAAFTETEVYQYRSYRKKTLETKDKWKVHTSYTNCIAKRLLTARLRICLNASTTVLGESLSQSQSYVTICGQSASLAWCQASIWGTLPDSYYCQTFREFVYVGRSLWREDGSVVYNYSWSSPAQSFWDPSPARLTIMFYPQMRDSPNLEGQVPVFISPKNKVTQLLPQALGSLFVACCYLLRWRIYPRPLILLI